MKVVSDLESYLVKVSKKLPHLPKKFLDWLYENVWWLVLVGVVLSAVVIVSTIQWYGLFFADMFGIVGHGGGANAVGLGIILSGVLGIIAVVVYGMAIMPLKEKRKRGWDLLFLASLISVAGSIVSALSSGWMVASNLLGVAIGLAIDWYFLFEIRGHYVSEAKSSDKNSQEKTSSTDSTK
ncbi:hypothetical protein EOL96_09370 [Candidatus Saccharibacteria bacterium]|nr:hypothetical protein [Candidatus Saccharibacteria bacterium]